MSDISRLAALLPAAAIGAGVGMLLDYFGQFNVWSFAAGVVMTIIILRFDP